MDRELQDTEPLFYDLCLDTFNRSVDHQRIDVEMVTTVVFRDTVKRFGPRKAASLTS